MTRTENRSLNGGLFVAFAVSLVASLAVAQESGYEAPPTLAASEVLALATLSGDHHHVAEEVRSDGYLNSFTVVSEFGEFEAYGELRVALATEFAVPEVVGQDDDNIGPLACCE